MSENGKRHRAWFVGSVSWILAALAVGAADDDWTTSGRCGPNCLYYLCRLEGRIIAYSDVVNAVPFDPADGATLTDMVEGAKKLRVPLEASQIPVDDWHLLRIPFIIHYDLPDRGGIHYLTVTHLTLTQSGQTAFLLDGETGELCHGGLEAIGKKYSGTVLCQNRPKRLTRFWEDTPPLKVALWSAVMALPACVAAFLLVRRSSAAAIRDETAKGGRR